MDEVVTPKYTWSYSSLSLFSQCPKKYHRLRIVKDIIEPEAEHLLYGTAAHLAAEEYIRDGTPLPAKFSFMQDSMDAMSKLKGEKHCELKMGLNKNLDACEFFAKDVWWRGVADLVVINKDMAYLIDYKTSKNAKYADTKQLELLSLALFKHFPQVKKVKAGLLFLVAKDFVKADYTNDEKRGTSWLKWLEETKRLETALKTEVWNPKPNFTCRGWCPVTDCSHWQERRK